MNRCVTCLALLALVASPVAAWAQRPEKPTKDDRAVRRVAAVVQLSSAAVAEGEPNDDHTTATAVTLGDQGTGVIDPAGDWDYWSFSATAGQIIEIDVDASEVGSDLDPLIELFASDGVTSVAFNDDWNSLDSRIEYTVETTGTYYLSITDYSTYWGYGDQGGATYTYTINYNILEPGPGDPVTTLIDGLRCIAGWAVGDDGKIYIGDPCWGSIYTVDASGTAVDFASDLLDPGPLTFDAFGNLIAVDFEDGNVYRVAMDGQTDTLIVGTYPGWVATAPNGDLWAGAGGARLAAADRGVLVPGSSSIYRYDPMGVPLDSVVLEGSWPQAVAFSPDGELFFTSGDSIWKVVGGAAQTLFGVECCVADIAFDADGNIYATNYNLGVVQKYAPDGTVLEDVFALGVESPGLIAFGRDSDGTPNTTIYVSDREGGIDRPDGLNVPTDGAEMIVELNAAGPDAPGARDGVSVEMLSDVNVADALMGVLDALTDGEKDFLDFMGNDNGQFDVGDLRAYLLYTGAIPEGTSSAGN